MEYVLTESEPEPHGDLIERYMRHVRAIDLTSGTLRAWHVLAARGLYRLLVDIELDGGPAAPMGMPHALCLSDAEACAMVSTCAE